MFTVISSVRCLSEPAWARKLHPIPVFAFYGRTGHQERVIRPSIARISWEVHHAPHLSWDGRPCPSVRNGRHGIGPSVVWRQRRLWMGRPLLWGVVRHGNWPQRIRVRGLHEWLGRLRLWVPGIRV